MLTGGSTSVRAFEARLREAGAAARALLCMAAAERWNVDWEELDTRDGFVWRGADRIPFAELAEAAARLRPARRICRCAAASRTGWPASRCRGSTFPPRSTARALFAGDVRLPDMVYAAVRSGPPGSRLAAVDKAAADRGAGRAEDASRIPAGRRWRRPIGGRRRARSTRCSPRFRLRRRPPTMRQHRRRARRRARWRRRRPRSSRPATWTRGFPGASPVERPLRGRPRPVGADRAADRDRAGHRRPARNLGADPGAGPRPRRRRPRDRLRRGPGDALSDARRRRLRPQARDRRRSSRRR